MVFGDEAKTVNEGQARNQRVPAAMATALQQLIPGHIGRYDDEWAPTAFGDNFSAWGTPVILIETGALHGRDEMFLVKMNFVAFVTAIQSIVTGSEKTQDPAAYISLPSNGSGGIVNYLFRRAHSVETWLGGELVGGLYGVAIGGLFAGESMFHNVRDSSKAALVGLVELIAADGDERRLIDVQWRTDHLASLGVNEVGRADYFAALGRALQAPPVDFRGT